MPLDDIEIEWDKASLGELKDLAEKEVKLKDFVTNVKLAPPVIKKPKRYREYGPETARTIVLRIMGDGAVHSLHSLKTALVAKGFADNGVGALLSKMQKSRQVEKVNAGMYRQTTNL
jgi:hypothetical protein